MPEVTYALDGGIVGSRDDSSLSPERGELTLAQGVWYKRGAGEAQMKAGRTAFNVAQIGSGGLAALYAEFSAFGASSQFVARADTSLLYDDAGLGGTGWHTASGLTLVEGSIGLWAAFANERYNFNDGASAPWIMRYDAANNVFIFRHAGMQPVSFQPVITPQSGGSAQITRYYPASIASTGDVTYDATQLAKVRDNDRITFATATLSAKDDFLRVTLGDFRLSNVDATTLALTEWALEETFEIVVTGSAKTRNLLEYCTDFLGAQTWKTLSDTGGAYSKVPAVRQFVAADGSLNSANLGLRLTVTKQNTQSKGDATVNLYDTRLYNTTSALSGGRSTTTGVYYWVTERIDSEGISSSISRNPDGTPTISKLAQVTNGSGFLVSLPSTKTNTAATHFDIWRTTDGGVYPNGTLAGSVLIDPTNPPLAFLDTSNPLAAASSIVYGFFNIGGVIFDRDSPPPIATVMTTFQNVIVVAPVDEPNVIRYSAAGFPESFPLMNRISLASERDDTVYGLGVLANVLGVFMHGRIRRITHLPSPTDPTFGAEPEDIATDHGLESKSGIAQMTPSNGEAALIAYVARDGIRVTDLYRSSIVTLNLDWAETVDVSALASARLVNNASFSRLELFFTPTSSFLTAQGWPQGVRCVIWLSYAGSDDGSVDMSRLRCTVHPAACAWAFNAPISGRDHTFMLSDGSGQASAGILYVDEMGDGDASHSLDSLGTVPRLVRTGRTYIGPSKHTRIRLRRLTVNRQAGAGIGRVIVTTGRDDFGGQRVPRTITFSQADGAISRIINLSGQWVQCEYDASSTSGTPPPVVDLAYDFDIMGEHV